MSVSPTPIDRAAAERLAKIFKEVDWLIPAYMTVGFINKFANAIEKAPTAERADIVSMTLAAVYNPKYLANMVLERYSKVMHVRDFGECQGSCRLTYVMIPLIGEAAALAA